MTGSRSWEAVDVLREVLERTEGWSFAARKDAIEKAMVELDVVALPVGDRAELGIFQSPSLPRPFSVRRPDAYLDIERSALVFFGRESRS